MLTRINRGRITGLILYTGHIEQIKEMYAGYMKCRYYAILFNYVNRLRSLY